MEATFERGRTDAATLRLLLTELKYRSTPRAAALRERVSAALSVEGEGTRSAPRVEEETDRNPQPRSAERPTAPTRPRPPAPVENKPANILAAWTALEVLSPFTYERPADVADGDHRRIATLNGSVPWPGEGSRPNKRLFYQVVLGTIRMADATRALLETFDDAHGDRRPARGFAPIAIATLDKEGRVVDEGLAISSFAWGLPIALSGDLVGLGGWSDAESRLVAGLDRQLRGGAAEGVSPTLDLRAIHRAFGWLKRELRLPNDLLDEPSFAVRVYHYWRAQEPPDAPLLGSFFLGDIGAVRRLISAGGAPANVQKYLGMDGSPIRKDVVTDHASLAAAVAPKRMPLARWPSKNPLVLLQQGAVNLAVSRLPETRLFAVNGPPGTGKTTLLRDVVAALVTQRAEEMCTFDDPEAAFTTQNGRSRDRAATWNVDPRLRGFEILVASSNNRAVENVSRELPSLGSVEGATPNLRYFKTTSDNVAGEPTTWGLIAAVLGNASNRFTFRERAWTDTESGLATYLAEVAGTPQWIDEPATTPDSAPKRRKPRVVERENPPENRQEAARRWIRTRDAFKSKIREVSAQLVDLEGARLLMGALPSLGEKVAASQRATDDAAAALRYTTDKLSSAQLEDQHARQQRADLASALRALEAERPGFWSRLFRRADADRWRELFDQARRDSDAAGRMAAVAATELQRLQQAKAHCADALGKHTQGLSAAQREYDEALKKVQATYHRFGVRVVDQPFFSRDHADVQLSVPWLDAEIQTARARLFEAAMAVHRAFVDAAADPILQNLEAFFKALIGRNAWTASMRPLMPNLWSTLFLVVPLVSTTFASIERMMGYLPPETLGWLLVDEAGQATPQSALGAVLRAKRAIIVGDPLQVEPVTSLPTGLAERICLEFGVDPNKWNAPDASVQTVADATATFGTQFRLTSSTVQVGFPLLVHRRCRDPMFSLSNRIAYGGKMVLGTPKRVSRIEEILGPSRWVDVPPEETEEKWSEAEGRAVSVLLERLSTLGPPGPDLYIVSPFRIVARRLRESVLRSGTVAKWSDDPQRWVNERVGTVHTVQGRESEGVIFVLGAALPSQHGARGWASKTPNILNVAATRAQENLYVVGHRAVWGRAALFSELSVRLP